MSDTGSILASRSVETCNSRLRSIPMGFNPTRQ